jgi:hypothetical protein
MAKPAAAASEEKVGLYEALIASLPGIERKGAKFPYTSLSGNMFSILSTEGVMGLRLSKADRAAFLRDHGASLFASHGAVMAEDVAVPDALLTDTARMEPYVAASLPYARTLKPKPTAKPKTD